MSCVANADAIEDDLSIVDNSFCPAAHDQVDVIPSLGFVSDFEYSNGKFIIYESKLMISMIAAKRPFTQRLMEFYHECHVTSPFNSQIFVPHNLLFIGY